MYLLDRVEVDALSQPATSPIPLIFSGTIRVENELKISHYLN